MCLKHKLLIFPILLLNSCMVEFEPINTNSKKWVNEIRGDGKNTLLTNSLFFKASDSDEVYLELFEGDHLPVDASAPLVFKFSESEYVTFVKNQEINGDFSIQVITNYVYPHQCT